MNVLIAGGTGFIGQHLKRKLVAENNQVFILTRNVDKYTNEPKVTYINYHHSIKQLPSIDVVINLAGETLFGFWTKKKKEAILSSRINTTNSIITLMKEMNPKPKTFISASAVGFYGMDDEMIFTEETTESGADFLATVTKKWEDTAKQAEKLQVRTVFARFGIVLDRNNGALPLMSLPVKSFVGGKIGSGKQWMSWIHIDDCVNLILYAIENEAISGPLNITAPTPKRNSEFTKILGDTLRRPTLLPVPAKMMQLILGDMSSLITEGQFVVPKKALDHNFTFNFPHLHEALQNIFQK